ncbi:enoyl-CoA hydratase/isomerase family protein [Georgenia sp. EYE_87]|uniref:enoyl-CoA hydratase-related protein n=1 Tax=Georgenia sp. EYE_87 TaxID=2853448 RepID=UPI00200533A2|nr:enoyl-CoA hydratase-related protein [Georgenia sp. EYE_87]MCK6208932.1 enoyl-CoA hydratase/isomerase family protein [Georgenia sp. EYE_87]
MAELVHLDVDGGIGTLTLDSPENRNALSAGLRRDLSRHLASAIADDAVRVLVLTHTGTVFCAGADLKEARGADADSQGVAELPDLLVALMGSPKPTVARLAGTARAGGIGLVAACDLAVAADDVTFSFPEVRLGLVPAVVSVPLRRRVQPQALRALFLTGEVFDAARAERIGLLDAAVPADRLDDEVARYADALLRGAPRALAATKAVLADPPDDDARELEVLGRLSAAHFASAEGQEGLSAFSQKRPPSWAPSN